MTAVGIFFNLVALKKLLVAGFPIGVTSIMFKRGMTTIVAGTSLSEWTRVSGLPIDSGITRYRAFRPGARH